MSDFSRPRGTRDFTPEEMAIRRDCERVMRSTLSSFGYEEIATPTFEYSDLFIERSGPQILEQIYNFKDKGGRDLVLRPELTAPVMRMYNSDLKSRPKPLRVQYFGNCFRYERPQKGRYREFWQMGLEYIGKRTPMANAEVINAAAAALDSIGLKEYVVRIGHVNLIRSILDSWNIDESRELMIAIDKKNAEELSRIIGEREEKDFLIDLLSNTVQKGDHIRSLNDVSSNLGSITDEDLVHLRDVMDLVSSKNGRIEMDLSITRGLDYYDGIVFEIDAPSLGAEKQICGGGAYSLSAVFGSEVEGIGFGLGFDRILVSLGNRQISNKVGSRVYILTMDDRAYGRTTALSEDIRRMGITCITETSSRPMKKAINYALGMGCTHIVLIGEDEIKKGGISIKDLRTKDQKFVSNDHISMDLFL